MNRRQLFGLGVGAGLGVGEVQAVVRKGETIWEYDFSVVRLREEMVVVNGEEYWGYTSYTHSRRPHTIIVSGADKGQFWVVARVPLGDSGFIDPLVYTPGPACRLYSLTCGSASNGPLYIVTKAQEEVGGNRIRLQLRQFNWPTGKMLDGVKERVVDRDWV